MLQKDIARELGVSEATVSRVAKKLRRAQQAEDQQEAA
jgi:DNA-binding LacI/PurR family transcriptional regulator